MEGLKGLVERSGRGKSLEVGEELEERWGFEVGGGELKETKDDAGEERSVGRVF